LDCLEIGPVVAGRLHTPLPEVVLEVGCGQTQPGRENRPALEVIRRDVSEPFFEVAGGKRGRSAIRGRPGGNGGEKRGDCQGPQAGTAGVHATSMGLTICDLPCCETSGKVFQLDRLPACLRLRTFAPSCPALSTLD